MTEKKGPDPFFSLALSQLDELYAIGGGPGANRPGLSAAEEEAHHLVECWMQDAGLETSRDAVGNLYGRLRGRRPELGEIWCGSHLDTVPSGGKFDGALGVIGSLAAVSGLEQGDRTVAVVAFRDEEGWRFGRGFFGSRAATGQLPPDAYDLADREGVTVRDALEQLGYGASDPASAPVDLPAVFLELHIEQGPVLAGRSAPVGIVESIVGLVELDVVFEGKAGHAGTTPMADRRDAALCAAAFQLEIADAARAIENAVATVGVISVEPGASNVIPRVARLVVDARAPDDDRVADLERRIRDAAERCAEAYGCTAEMGEGARTHAVLTDPAVKATATTAANGAPALPSGAGHDAQILGMAGVPVGMVFARSLAGGVSHSPLEDTSAEDVGIAIGVLQRALAELASAP
ncbi:MAG: allantoate deiminase [Gaiellales bacterium]|jgi:allantoate deiminase|nr:allantoate deiminase [Gaiellales bacterium]